MTLDDLPGLGGGGLQLNVPCWFTPGTAAEISRNGGPFVAFQSETLLTFARPFADTGDDFIFAGDSF